MTDLEALDLIEALCNPLLVADERFGLTRKAAAELARLRAAEDHDLRTKRAYRAEIERLRATADSLDQPEERNTVAALVETLRDHRCIVDNRMIVSECVDGGYCGCTTGLVLKSAKRLTDDEQPDKP